MVYVKKHSRVFLFSEKQEAWLNHASGTPGPASSDCMCTYRLFAGVHWWSPPPQYLFRTSHPLKNNPKKHWTHQDQNHRKFLFVNIRWEHFIVCQDLSCISLTHSWMKPVPKIDLQSLWLEPCGGGLSKPRQWGDGGWRESWGLLSPSSGLSRHTALEWLQLPPQCFCLL